MLDKFAVASVFIFEVAPSSFTYVNCRNMECNMSRETLIRQVSHVIYKRLKRSRSQSFKNSTTQIYQSTSTI
jgi:hypothetical protein